MREVCTLGRSVRFCRFGSRKSTTGNPSGSTHLLLLKLEPLLLVLLLLLLLLLLPLLLLLLPLLLPLLLTLL